MLALRQQPGGLVGRGSPVKLRRCPATVKVRVPAT